MFLAAFILGLSVGAAGVNAVVGHRIDELHIQQRELKEQLSSSQTEAVQLKKNLAEQSNRRLLSINVQVLVDHEGLSPLEQEQVELETVRSVKQRLQPLLGQDLANLNYHQAALMVNGRETTLNGRTYIQKVDLVIVADSLNLFVTVSPSQ